MGKKHIHTDKLGNEFVYEDEVFTVHVRRPSHVGKKEIRDYIVEALTEHVDPVQHRLAAAKFTVRKPPFQGERAKNA